MGHNYTNVRVYVTRKWPSMVSATHLHVHVIALIYTAKMV